jgi:molybdopterin-guanine dinucleotide biosynthesis protein A
VLLGAGRAVAGRGAALPRLADAVGVAGPLAGLLAALRAGHAAWLVVPCDLPLLSPAAIEWLVAQRGAGRWAVLPRVNGRVQPLLALYEPEALALVEAIAMSGSPSPSRLAGHPRVASPVPPEALAPAWSSANTPAELARLVGAASPPDLG